jgi:hypothetical protein
MSYQGLGRTSIEQKGIAKRNKPEKERIKPIQYPVNNITYMATEGKPHAVKPFSKKDKMSGGTTFL